MAPPVRINAQHYYDLLPGSKHRCGDIWTGINPMGLLGAKRITAIVVTPACDLENNKSETITLLPVLPLRSHFSTVAVLPELRRAVDASLVSGKFEYSMPWSAHPYRPPSISAIESAVLAINQHLGEKQRSAEVILFLERAKAALEICKQIASCQIKNIGTELLSASFKDWSGIKSRLITNSQSAYMHFLPADGQSEAFSGLPEHSLVLFRYPLTVPVEVLDLAANTTQENWENVAHANVDAVPFLNNYLGQMPMKRLSMKAEFLADLLSRYVIVYNRIGSPDFTASTVGRFSSEVDQ